MAQIRAVDGFGSPAPRAEKPAACDFGVLTAFAGFPLQLATSNRIPAAQTVTSLDALLAGTASGRPDHGQVIPFFQTLVGKLPAQNANEACQCRKFGHEHGND
jgi:hypothetical protein